MLGRAIVEVIPAALAVAITPVFGVAVMLIPDDRRSHAAAASFVSGWVLALAAGTTIAVAVTDSVADDLHSESGVAWAMGVIGLLFIALAVKKWIARRTAGDGEASTPRWAEALAGVRPSRALLFGVLLLVANPKNLALVFAAATSIAYFGLDRRDAAFAVFVFVLIGSIAAIGAVGAAMLVPDRVAGPLGSVRRFLTANMATILGVLGVFFVIDAAAGAWN